MTDLNRDNGFDDLDDDMQPFVSRESYSADEDIPNPDPQYAAELQQEIDTLMGEQMRGVESASAARKDLMGPLKLGEKS